MIEKAIVTAIVVVVALSMLATVLPRLLPAITVLFVFGVAGRVVWWYTRQ